MASSFTFSFRSASLAGLGLLLTLALLDRLFADGLEALLRDQIVGPYAQADAIVERARPQLLVLGSSRAQRHYVPSILRKSMGKVCLNGGRDGQGLPYSTGLLHLALKRYTPELVILDLGNADLVRDPSSTMRVSSLSPYYHRHPDLAPYLEVRGDHELLKLRCRCYAYNSKVVDLLRYRLLPFLTPDDDSGYIPVEGRMTSLPPVASGPSLAQPVSPELVELLAVSLRECREKQIKFLGVFSPSYVDDSKCTSRRVLEDLLKENGFAWLDFTNNSDFAGRPELFSDPRHLNHEGAELFTTLLSQRLREEGF